MLTLRTLLEMALTYMITTAVVFGVILTIVTLSSVNIRCEMSSNVRSTAPTTQPALEPSQPPLGGPKPK